MVKGVFFDFNGTLYFDQDINRETWKQTIAELSNNTIDFDRFFDNYKAVMDYIVIKDAFELIKKPYNEKQINYWVNYKEEKYRNYGIEHKRTVLPPGAEKTLDYLKSNSIPIILCTSSIIENVEFYYKYFNLSKWFNFKQTVYDTGEYSSKTQMYLECAKRLNIDLADGVVFEDSSKSIKEAIVAGAKKVVAIKRNDTPSFPEIKQVISDFTELDYSIFE